LRDAIQRRAFPCAAVVVGYRGELVWQTAVGRFTYNDSSPAVSADTVFDLASVSKVVATTAMAMILYERGRFELDAR
jgi:CubicO group peptidase (beta-lactamase class C family)